MGVRDDPPWLKLNLDRIESFLHGDKNGNRKKLKLNLDRIESDNVVELLFCYIG